MTRAMLARLGGLGLWLVAATATVAGCGSAGGAVPVASAPVPSSTSAPPPAPEPTAAGTAKVVAEAAPPVPPAPQTEIEVTPLRGLVTADKDDEIYARVRVKGLPLANAKRPPINVALVVDASASMEGSGIEQARAACGALVDALGLGDAFSIVTFGSQPKVVVAATRVTEESRNLAHQAIDGIRADGTTDLTGGLRVGIEQARVFLDASGINRVVLVGDGVPNEPGTVLAFADQARSLRVPVSSLGLGPEFDETLMASIAQRSGGTFHFIDKPERVTEVFKNEIARMERLVARNTWLDVVPGPGVTIDSAIGVQGTRSGRAGLRVSLGDLAEGQARDVILKVRLTKHPADARVELFDAVLHHTAPAGGPEQTTSKFLSAKASADAAAIKAATSVEIERQVTRVRVADAIVRAIAMARNGDVAGARKLLTATEKLASEGAKRFGDAELDAKAKEIAGIKKTIASLAPPLVHLGSLGTAGRGAGASAAPASPAQALKLRAAHGAAVRDITGD